MAANEGNGGRTRRRYSAKERAEIVADAEALGQSEAVRKHGVPQSTLSPYGAKTRSATPPVFRSS